MFEAVGEKYWSKYFDVLKKNLKTDGSIGLQTITIEDKFFKNIKSFQILFKPIYSLGVCFPQWKK